MTHEDSLEIGPRPALGLTIILNFSLSALLGGNWIPVLLEKRPMHRVRLKLPAHCVHFGMRTGSAWCAAFAYYQDRTRAKPH